MFIKQESTGTERRELPGRLAGREYPRRADMVLQCEVMFGSPSSNCDGNGICKIVARSEQPALRPVQRTRCDHARALFSAIDGGKGASLCFRREWLCSKLMKHHFRHGVLEMPEPCPIPQEIARALGLSIGELPAGLHLIEDYGTHFRINIRFNKIA